MAWPAASLTSTGGGGRGLGEAESGSAQRSHRHPAASNRQLFGGGLGGHSTRVQLVAAVAVWHQLCSLTLNAKLQSDETKTAEQRRHRLGRP